MDDETTKVIASIKGELFALRTILFSAIMAADSSDPGFAKTTIEIAESQVQPTWAADMTWEAMKLATMITDLTRVVGPLADND